MISKLGSKDNPRKVVFEVDRNTGDLTCTPTVLHAQKKDFIKFSARGGAFSVVSKGISPLDRADIRGIEGYSAIAQVIIDTAGAYPFACAMSYVAKDGNVKISMDANCPPIIIDHGFQK